MAQARWRGTSAAGASRPQARLMEAVLGGLVAAISWGLAPVAAARASRTIGAWSATGWVVLVGLVASIPLLILERPTDPVDPAALGWLGVAALGYVTGLVLSYSALTGSKIPIVAPITSTEGAIAAVLAVLGGEPAGLLLLAMLAVIAMGTFVAVLRPGGTVDSLSGDGLRYALFAVAAAGVFGLGLYASGRATEALPPGWIVAAGRVIGVALLTLPLLLTRRLRFERELLPVLVLAGLAEVVGVYGFVWGAQDSIAVAAVFSSQFALVAGLAAHVSGERISLRQWGGVVAVAGGVAVIALTRA